MTDSFVVFSVALLLSGVFSGCLLFGCFYFAFWRGKRAERRLTNFFDRRPNRTRNCSASVAHPNPPMPSNSQRQQIRKNEIPSVRPCPRFLPYSPPPAYDEACSTAISIADEPSKHNKINIVGWRHQSNKNVTFPPHPPSYIK